MKKPLILITNDDGIKAPGLIALEKVLTPIAECLVVCPIRQCSSVGQAVTLRKHIEVFRFKRSGGRFAYGIDGTPVDCVKFALCELIKRKPDLAVSGINNGGNTGISVYYSGTIGGAREALIGGIPSIAFSLHSHTSTDFRFASKIAEQLVLFSLKHGIPANTLLNVNIPATPTSKIRGIKVVPQADSRFIERFVKEGEEDGKLKFRLTGEMVINDRSIETDQEALKKGYVTVTPLQLDLTRYDTIKMIAKRIKGWFHERSGKHSRKTQNKKISRKF